MKNCNERNRHCQKKSHPRIHHSHPYYRNSLQQNPLPWNNFLNFNHSLPLVITIISSLLVLYQSTLESLVADCTSSLSFLWCLKSAIHIHVIAPLCALYEPPPMLSAGTRINRTDGTTMDVREMHFLNQSLITGTNTSFLIYTCRRLLFQLQRVGSYLH